MSARGAGRSALRVPPELLALPPDRARVAVSLASEIAAAINAGMSLGEVCRVMAAALLGVYDLRWGSISLLDETNTFLDTTALDTSVETAIDRGPRNTLQGSLMGWVVLSQRPMILADVAATDALPEQQSLLRVGLLSVAMVPIMFRDKIIGTFNLGSGSPGELTPEEQPIYVLLAELVALAIGRARAEVVKRQSTALSLLSEVGRLAQSTLDLDRLLGAVAGLVRDHFHASFAGFSVFDSRRSGIVLKGVAYASGVAGPGGGSTRLIPDTLVRQVVEEKRLVIAEDRRLCYPPLVPGDWSQVMLSLRSGERLRGVLEVGRSPAEPFAVEELGLLETLSDRMAGALDTAALFAELEATNRDLSGARDELAILYEIGRVATSTLDLDRILGPVARMVCDNFGYDFAAIFLTRDADLELRSWAAAEPGAEHDPAAVRLDTVKVRVEIAAQANHSSLVRDVARVGETLVVSNTTRNPRSAPLLAHSASAAAIPLKVGVTVVGVMTVESARANAFDLEDVRILETLSDQLASAIDNARLYRELLAANERQARTFRELRNVQDDLMQATRLAALGEMSGRVAHEVLNPMTGVLARVQSDIKRLPSPERSGLVLVQRIVERWREAERSGDLMAAMREELDRKGGDRYLSLVLEILTGAAAMEGQLREDLAFVERHCLRIVKIVDSLRGLARQSQARERGSIVPILREAVELARDGCERRRIQLVESYPSNLPDVEVDPSEIVQVVSNVLQNAVQAIEATGRPGRITVQASCREGVLEIRIRDTGGGILPEHAPYLFEQDFTTKDRSMGTGLGLAICRRFLRGYDGDIVLEESEMEQGSVFLLTIPC